MTAPTGPGLFDEIRLAGRVARNRIAMAPLTRQAADADGTPNAAMAAYYARRARGGVGAVFTEGVTFSDATGSKAYPHQPGLVTGRHADGWRQLVAAVHAEGALILMQLQHAGRVADPADLPPGVQPLSASDTQAPGYVIFTDSWEEKELRGWDFDPPFRPYVPARAMTAADLAAVRDEFAAAAAWAVELGFDGVEVHAANGFLLEQFVDSTVNRRTDAYGGSPARRVQYPLEVCGAVRAAVGDDAIVTLRLSQEGIDDTSRRFAGGVAEAREIGAALCDAPVDALHWASFDWEDTRDPADDEPMPHALRAASGLPVIVNGGVHDRSAADRVLSSRAGDMVAVDRPLFANPDWARLVRDGGPVDWVPFERRWVVAPAP